MRQNEGREEEKARNNRGRQKERIGLKERKNHPSPPPPLLRGKNDSRQGSEIQQIIPKENLVYLVTFLKIRVFYL